MLQIRAETYFRLLSDLSQCKTPGELVALEAKIKDICDTEIELARQVFDVRNATFTLMIEKITSIHGMKSKQFSDEHAQARLNRWTLMVGTFAMVVVSAVSTVMMYLKK